VLQDAVDEIAGDVVNGLRVVVEGGDDGIDGGASFCDRSHVANVNEVKGSFSDAEDERPAFLERNVGGALNEVGSDAVRDSCERTHGAGENNHGRDWAGAAGDGSADILVRKVLNFCRSVTEKFFGEIVFCRQAFFFSKHSERRR